MAALRALVCDQARLVHQPRNDLAHEGCSFGCHAAPITRVLQIFIATPEMFNGAADDLQCIFSAEGPWAYAQLRGIETGSPVSDLQRWGVAPGTAVSGWVPIYDGGFLRVAVAREETREAVKSAPPRIPLSDPETNRTITATVSPAPIPAATAIRSNPFPQLAIQNTSQKHPTSQTAVKMAMYRTGCISVLIDSWEDIRVRTYEEYQQKAAECLEQANSATDPTNRALLLEMAQAWIRLADETKTRGSRSTSGPPQ
jgi:hypothetical protein